MTVFCEYTEEVLDDFIFIVVTSLTIYVNRPGWLTTGTVNI